MRAATSRTFRRHQRAALAFQQREDRHIDNLQLGLFGEHGGPGASDTLTLSGRLSWQTSWRRNQDSAERAVLGGAGALRP